MKAIIYHNYGLHDALKCEEVEKPAPGDDEVLVRVYAASVNPLDWRLMRGKPYAFRLFLGLRKPRDTRVGVDVAGRVEAVGRNVTRLKTGDEVFGACRGALAEYACAPESKLAFKPENVTFEQAATLNVAALTALQALRDKGRVRPGQKVLINGAAGGVGTFAVQLARYFGAEATGVCSAGNVEMVRAIGADHAIDYTRQDFTEGTGRYDLILECVGNRSLSACRRVLNPGGKCIIIGAPHNLSMIGLLSFVLAPPVSSWFVSRKAVTFVARSNREDLARLGELVAAGKVTPIIDRRYRLSEAPEAIRYLEEGHARGKVVITLGRDNET